jgi:hypothetical protein
MRHCAAHHRSAAGRVRGAHRVIGGKGAFMEVANGYEDFARAMRRKFHIEIAGLKKSVARVSQPAPR